jgi:hypothetical protein
MSDRNIAESSTTVEALLRTQIVVPTWVQEKISGLLPSDPIIITRQFTPFGTFLLGIETPQKAEAQQ